MDPRTAATRIPDPDAIEFVRFCYRRRRVGWPELYDEMCAVAGRGLYRGYDSDDLAEHGIGFALFDMPALAALAARVIEEERAMRRPVSVVINDPEPIRSSPAASLAMATSDATAPSNDVAPRGDPVARPEPARPEPALRFSPVPAGA